ncbi:hypothetical protein MASR2M70_06590 [Bacillota bacterium]
MLPFALDYYLLKYLCWVFDLLPGGNKHRIMGSFKDPYKQLVVCAEKNIDKTYIQC